MSILLAILGAISQGVLWGLLTLGVYITFKILDFPDMTVDGSFALGGAVSALLIVKGVNPWLAVLPAMCAGMVAGAVTGLLHTKVKTISNLCALCDCQACPHKLQVLTLGKHVEATPCTNVVNVPTKGLY